MMRKAVWIPLLLWAVVLGAGCIVRGHAGLSVPPPPHVQVDVGARVAPPPPPHVQVGVGARVGPPPPAVIHARIAPPPTATISVLGSTCNPNAREVLNGIDDNCNGQVDEGFVGGGDLQFTLWWNSGADLDLHVTDPTGAEIYYGNRLSPSGGQLDVDGRGYCGEGEEATMIENIFWTSGPPAGNYVVRIQYYESERCNVGPTTFVLSVSAGGESSAQQGTLAFGESLEFDVGL